MEDKKPVRAKKIQHHGQSILQKKKECYLCRELMMFDRFDGLHKHHIFGGPNRSRSEEHGFWVWLCPGHHVYGKYAVHMNQEMMRYLQQDCEKRYLMDHTLDEWMSLMGRNYL